jgi:hypothetical protein
MSLENVQFIDSASILSLNATGSLYGTSLTASYITSSNVHGTVTSSSYAISASYALTYTPLSTTQSISASYVSSSNSIINTLNGTTNLNLNASSGWISFQTSGSEKLRIFNNGNITNYSQVSLVSASNNSQYYTIQLWGNGFFQSALLALTSPASHTLFIGINATGSTIGGQSGYPIIFKDNVDYNNPDPLNSGTETMRLQSGKVGIGGIYPLSNSLDVAGNISCSAVTASIGKINTLTSSIELISGSSQTPLSIVTNTPNYTQLIMQNTTSSNSASTDMVITNDKGAIDSNGYYIDTGINSSLYNQGFVGNANEGYHYFTGSSSNNNFFIGNATPNSNLNLFAGGIINTASVILDYNNNLSASNFVGPTNINLTAANGYASIFTGGSEKYRFFANGNVSNGDFTNQPGAASNSQYYVAGHVSTAVNGKCLFTFASRLNNTAFIGNDSASVITIGGEGAGRQISFKTGISYGSSDPLLTGTEVMRINNTGVGIGTLPVNTLDVAGNISCSIITSSLFNGVANSSIISYPWFTRDIGTGILVGSSSYSSSNNTFTIIGGGGDIWGNADAFRYMFMSMTGNKNTMITYISSQSDGDASWSKSGLMIRDSLSSAGANAMICITSGNGIAFQYRSTDSGSSTTTTAAGTVPIWVKLYQNGTQVTGSYSSDGVSWTQLGATNLTMSNAATPYMGLAVTAHDSSLLCTSNFQNTALPSAVITIPVG